MPGFDEKVAGAMFGHAIGDAMGAPVEGWSPEAIADRFGERSLEEFLPPTHGGDPATGKGAGRITDDTLMAEALIRGYAKARSHMDAYGYARFVAPEVGVTKVWIPEQQREAPIFERLWFPEKYLWQRLSWHGDEPRAAGRGNCVNCGVAMYMWPVGAVNAGDPLGAYLEAADMGLAHNESFAVEAGAVMAAAAAEAFAPDATVESVLAVAERLAQDGTRRAIAAAIAASDPAAPLGDFIASVRGAVRIFDARARHLADDSEGACVPSDVGKPSKVYAIEELPVALACLKYGTGDWRKTLLSAVRYGRDCDSIAGMASALFGALMGECAIPDDLKAASQEANRRDWRAVAASLAEVAREIASEDERRFMRRRKALGR